MLFVLMILGLIALGGLVVYIIETRFHKPRDNQPFFAKRKFKPKRKSTYEPETMEPSTAKLQMRKKLDNEITVDTITLVADISFNRDECYGWVDIWEAHQLPPPAHHESDKLQSWAFSGSGDRHNSLQRGADFDYLAKQFKNYVDIIISQFSADGWTYESVTETGRKRVYLLSR